MSEVANSAFIWRGCFCFRLKNMLLNNGPRVTFELLFYSILQLHRFPQEVKPARVVSFIKLKKKSQELLEFFLFSREALRFSISCLQNKL